MELPVLALQSLLVVVFACSATAKVAGQQRYAQFVESVRALRLVPDYAAGAVAAGTILAEAAVALALLAPPLRRQGFVLAAVVLAGLTAALWVTLQRGLDAPCPCFGATGSRIRLRQVVRNALLLAAAMAGAAGAAGEPSYSTVVAGHLGEATVSMCVGGVAALVVVRLDDIVDLFSPTRELS